MAESSPQCPVGRDHEQPGHPSPPTLPPHLRYSVGRDPEQPELSSLPASSTHYQAARVGPEPIPYINGSRLFHIQEREFFSRATSFIRVQIDIDLPHNPQAIGGPYVPPRVFTPRQKSSTQSPQQPSPSSSTSYNISPLQHQSSSEYWGTRSPSQPPKPKRSQMTPINPLPAVAGSTNNHHIRLCQATRDNSQYPYPPPEMRHNSSTIINGSTQRRRTPYPERSRAGTTPRREAD